MLEANGVIRKLTSSKMALIGREGSGMQGLALAMKFQCSRHLYRTQKNRNSPVDLQLKSRWLNNKFLFGLKKIKL